MTRNPIFSNKFCDLEAVAVTKTARQPIVRPKFTLLSIRIFAMPKVKAQNYSHCGENHYLVVEIALHLYIDLIYLHIN
uniref:Uncharacterized protein n=1 Tax=Romanomermis culicivorax TaxID=13658 RepID=A0A915ILH0_ROMCU